MRLRVFMSVFVSVVAIALIGWTGTAAAKGPDRATISGDGVESPVVLNGTEGEESPLWVLVEQTGFFPALFSQVPDPMLDTAPTTDLGPKLVITWRVPGPDPTPDTITQDVYPQAAGGPLTYTEPGVSFFGTELTRGGWYQAPPSLLTTLDAIGATAAEPAKAAPTTTEAAAVAPVAAPTPARPAGDDGLAVWPFVIVAVVAVAAVVGGWRLFGVRRRPQVAGT